MPEHVLQLAALDHVRAHGPHPGEVVRVEVPARLLTDYWQGQPRPEADSPLLRPLPVRLNAPVRMQVQLNGGHGRAREYAVELVSGPSGQSG